MSRLILLSCLVVVLCATSCFGLPSSNLCPDTTWAEYDGCCYHYVTERRSWQDAMENCRELAAGSDLASVHNTLEDTLLLYFLMSQHAVRTDDFPFIVWIGVNDIDNEGTFVNADGSDFDFANWLSGEPNNYRDAEDCVFTCYAYNKWGWNDNTCQSLLPSVCKITAS